MADESAGLAPATVSGAGGSAGVRSAPVPVADGGGHARAKGGADAQAARVFADAFAMEAAKDARKVDGMDAGFGAEIVETELVGVFRVEFFEDAGEPRGRMVALFNGEAGGEAGELGEQAFDAKRIGKFGGSTSNSEPRRLSSLAASISEFSAACEAL